LLKHTVIPHQAFVSNAFSQTLNDWALLFLFCPYATYQRGLSWPPNFYKQFPIPMWSLFPWSHLIVTRIHIMNCLVLDLVKLYSP
jgi:hypothetical protein